ncbi:hypothetical protein CASFOL_008088 [Castilleja foliolosa]|uniref:Uncharacterized protein n=1 Tax=Castilleja foliolosa TaxID=1961234 RepID=A0ABD3CIC4_9LAMI
MQIQPKPRKPEPWPDSSTPNPGRPDSNPAYRVQVGDGRRGCHGGSPDLIWALDGVGWLRQ